MELIIRENIPQYMEELRTWLADIRDSEPEEMGAFFSARLDGYEEHMLVWEKAYCRLAERFPAHCRRVLDLGCGTGLVLDFLLEKYPALQVTGVDLNADMLARLHERHQGRDIRTVCADYFSFAMPADMWDAVISMESLHHFLPEKKVQLYRKIADALPADGTFLCGDYIACCPEEEALLLEVWKYKRQKFNVPEKQLIHFDIPLTLEHETEILQQAGFAEVTPLESVDGVTIIQARK